MEKKSTWFHDKNGTEIYFGDVFQVEKIDRAKYITERDERRQIFVFTWTYERNKYIDYKVVEEITIISPFSDPIWYDDWYRQYIPEEIEIVWNMHDWFDTTRKTIVLPREMFEKKYRNEWWKLIEI